MRGRKGYGFIALLALLLLSTTGAFAADKTWTGGGGDNNWSTAGNWAGGVPGAADTAIFNENVTVDLDAAASVKTIRIADGKKVTLNTGTNALTIANTGEIKIGVDGTLTMDGANGVKFSAGSGTIGNLGKLIGRNGGRMMIPDNCTVTYTNGDWSKIEVDGGINLDDSDKSVLVFDAAKVDVLGDSLKGGANSVIRVTNGSVLRPMTEQAFTGTVELDGGTLGLNYQIGRASCRERV